MEPAAENADDADYKYSLVSADGNPRRLKLHRELVKKEVPYVPTDEAVVAAMLRLAGVTSADVVYDLGCGDGRIVIHAARHFGCRGVGVDIDPFRIQECRENAIKARVADRVQFHCKSFFDTDLRDATLVTLYLLPSINVKLRPKLMAELRPGARIIANYFDLGDWEPDMQAEAHHRKLMQWVVPAWVEGRWNCVVNDPAGRHRIVLDLHRTYQNVTGTARLKGVKAVVQNGKLFGDQLTFKLAGARAGERLGQYRCVIDGSVMRGTCLSAWDGSPTPWGGTWAGRTPRPAGGA